MTGHLRLVASIILALLTYAVMIRALHWMSQPSDARLYGGIAMILVLLLVVPLVLKMIWRKL